MKHLVIVLFVLHGTATAQEAGTAEAYRQERRSAEAGRAISVQQENAKAADPFAKVTDIQSFAKAANEARRRAVAGLYDRRDKFRTQKMGAAAKAAGLASANQRIREINKPSKQFIPDVVSPQVTTLGEYNRHLIVEEVVDGKNAIVKCVELVAGGRDRSFWLTGVNTAGWFDGKRADVKGVLIGAGTKTYPTVDGGNATLPMMKPLDFAGREELLTRKDQVRRWTTRDGKTFDGALLLYDQGKLAIEDMDGKTASIKLTDLDDANRKYFEENTPVDLPSPRRVPR